MMNRLKRVIIVSLIFVLTSFVCSFVDTPQAGPAPLENYSMGGGSAPEGGITSFTAEVTVQSESAQSSQITTDVVYYYHNDHLGTLLFMSDEAGGQIWRREQTPFGETTFERGAATENLRMPGQYWDAEKNSSYNLYRDTYFPNLGRYGQADPLGQKVCGACPYLSHERLTKVVDSATQATKGEYTYDGLGCRVKKTAGGVTTYYLYDLAGRLITEVDGSGKVVSDRAYLEGQPLARVDVNVQLQVKPSASSFSNKVCVNWNAVAGASYYIVCWGDTSGYYPNCSGSLTSTSYCVTNLSGLTWYFIVRGYDTGNNLITESNEKSVTLVTSNPSLPHYSYNASISGQTNCDICHVQPGTFLQGFGVRTSISICLSCHNTTSVGHDKPYGGKTKHSTFANITINATHKWPTLGSLTGLGSDNTYTHLYKGRQVVCMTCHNSKTKPNDPGRSWEYTTTIDYKTYTLQKGGWSYYSYVRAIVYRDTVLWSGPSYLKDRKKYLVAESEYDIDAENGAIIFHQQQATNVYIYVTLGNSYLRNTNENNQLCLDCHVIGTHKDTDCTVCHGTHSSDNLYNIRPSIRTNRGALKEVSYKTISSLSGNKGLCAICHTATLYHNSTAIAPQQHFDNKECGKCHPHKKGFPTYTTVLRSFVSRLLAFIGFKNAYAEPPPLQTYSMGGGAPEGGSLILDATVETVQTQSSQQTITTDVIYYYHNDHLGTPMFLSDESGKEVWRREQMPYGDDNFIRGVITENLRLPGQYNDQEKYSNYNFHRDNYFSNLGRYGQPDPIGQDGGINPFIYAQTNPLKYIDPTGEEVRLCQRALSGLPIRIGPFHHAYLNVNGLIFGFHPESNSLFDKGSVRIEEPGKDIKCGKPLKCVDDNCVLQKIYESHENPPDYSFGFYDCRAWARTIVLLCHKKNCCEGK